MDHYVKLFRVIGSPGYPVAEPVLRERIWPGCSAVTTRRARCARWWPLPPTPATVQQSWAHHAPTLVLHGKDDPLVPLPLRRGHGQAHSRRPLVGIDGMGHDLPPGVVERLLNPWFRTCSSIP
jgi:pimeloyl-ACP methyl ester carboxylesterase